MARRFTRAMQVVEIVVAAAASKNAKYVCGFLHFAPPADHHDR